MMPPIDPTPNCVRVSERYDLLIFDADGTLRKCKVPGQPCPNKPDEWELIDGVEKLAEVKWGVTLLPNGERQRKYFAIASNQAGVADGYMSEECAYSMLLSLAEKVTRQEADWRSVRMCPHAADAGCDCRKPKPGLPQELIGAYRMVLPKPRTLFVGDQESDQQAARAAGIDFMWAWDFFGRTREEWAGLIGGLAPLKIVDTRSERWKAAEARCTASHADPADLAIIAEEQAKWDAANPEVPPAGVGERTAGALSRGALWNAINRYVETCGGDPSKHVYGNTSRQLAVAQVERAVDACVAARK